MRLGFIRFTAMAAVAMIGWTATPAAAETVQFTMSGSFSITSGSTYTGSTVTITQGANTWELAFVPVGEITENLADGVPFVPPSGFGTIEATASGGGALELGSNDSFALSISQTLPSSDDGSILGQVTGKVHVQGGNVVITFDGPLTLPVSPDPGNPWVTYTLNTITIPTNGGPQTLTGTVTVHVPEVAAVPLPGVAWAGLALFGLVGASRLRRRQAQAA